MTAFWLSLLLVAVVVIGVSLDDTLCRIVDAINGLEDTLTAALPFDEEAS